MDKNKLMDDIPFRNRCCTYGLSWEDFNIYENTIILNTPKKDVFVLLDENYNTIDILKMVDNDYQTTIENHLLAYKSPNYLPYPFQDFSLKQLLDLANRISIDRLRTFVNDKLVFGNQNNSYILLLTYVKFLSEQIEQYFLNAFQMKIMGFSYPDAYSYINSLIQNINECIMLYIENEKRPFPIDIINYLGQDPKVIDKYNLEPA